MFLCGSSVCVCVCVHVFLVFAHVTLLILIYVCTSGDSATDVLKKGLEDLNSLCEVVLSTFKVSHKWWTKIFVVVIYIKNSTCYRK